MQKKYEHSIIEKKWQKKWDVAALYVADIDNGKNPFYNLWMFPYPSAEGLHAGHAFASTGSDIVGRFMRMNGKDVFQPIGYDSFGIHSENYAIKINQNPQEVIKRTTKHYEEQMRSLGHGYDWTRTVTTSDPGYYKWTQWIFLKMFENGLAYKKKASVNFCPSCKTVLADEQVMNPKSAGKDPKNAEGKVVEYSEELKVCERCGTIVEKKDLDQWFFKITDYAERLLTGLEKINWSQRVVSAQKNWIGRSEGRNIEFEVEGKNRKIKVFTTRPDTINSATFLAVASKEGKDKREKWGKFTDEYAVNPLTGDKLPIWETNYVDASYGTGAIMGVPAYDERDREFAVKYHIDIVEKPFTEEILGEKTTRYHLRDWLVSRQRYWGAPIPMIYCEHCASQNSQADVQGTTLHRSGWFPVAEKDLPVLLPSMSDYKPEGTGRGPLANHKEFFEVKCPKCGGEAKRETDVMDTFVDSSWYFLRYPSVDDSKNAFDAEITKKWLPVNLYFGGAEHSVLHLMYCRFVTMVLHDLKYLDFDEPISKFFAHGLMIKDGAKMSKSRGNVVNPDEYVEKYGADTLRLYLAFMGPMDSSSDFRDSGMEGVSRFLGKVWRLLNEKPKDESNPEVLSKLHQTIKKVTNDIEEYKFNTAISSLMELVNTIIKHGADKETLKILTLLLAPFAPHLTEEVWVEVLKESFSIHKASWPKYDAKYLKVDQINMVVQVNGKHRGTLTIDSELSSQKSEVTRLIKENEEISKWIKNETIKKVVFVPGKIINFVI